MSKFESASGGNGELRSALEMAMARGGFPKPAEKPVESQPELKSSAELAMENIARPTRGRNVMAKKEVEQIRDEDSKKEEFDMFAKLPVEKVADFIRHIAKPNPDMVGEKFDLNNKWAEKYLAEAIKFNKAHKEQEPASELKSRFEIAMEKTTPAAPKGPEELKDTKEVVSDKLEKETPLFSENPRSQEGTEINLNQVSEAGVLGSRNFDELLKVVENSSGLQGSEHYFEANYLKEAIDLVRKGAPIEYITRSAGLRDKVQELVLREQMEVKNKNAKTSVESVQADAIRKTESFNALFGKIAEWGGIDEEGRHWGADDVVNQTNDFLSGKRAALLFPNVGGLHEKIYELKKKRDSGEEFKPAAKVEKKPGLIGKFLSGIRGLFSRKQ